jgi:hypothetical protein
MKTIFCVGGGPSLVGFDWRVLKGQFVIAVNRAFEVVPCAEYVYFSDARFWNWYAGALRLHAGIKITVDRQVKDKDVINYRATGTFGLDLIPGQLRTGNSSGFAAINLAAQMKPSKIVLLGYDMKYTDRTHWHDGYPVRSGRIEKMIAFFPTLVEPLKELGIDIVNANPDSALECFRKETIDEFC